MFTPRAARRSLKRYRAKGLDGLERQMVASVSQEMLDDGRVLEIGGGIGVIQSTLLESGAGRGEIVEVVSAYEPYARELAREKGLADRVTFRVVDVLESPESVEPADVVVLNRVVCCSPDGVELAAAAARLTRRALVLSFPRDVFWVRAAIRVLNAGFWLLRRSFRTFVHRPAALIGTAEGEGLRAVDRGSDGVWEFVTLRRAA
jgi:magnesium-protoporphyrin O-methyltransferase